MQEDDSAVTVINAQNQLGQSYQHLCSSIATYNLRQLEKRKAYFINSLEAADLDTCMSLVFIEKSRENALNKFPLKNVDDELKCAIPHVLSSGRLSPGKPGSPTSYKSSYGSPVSQKQKPDNTVGLTRAGGSPVPSYPSPPKPSWSGSMSLTSTTKGKAILLDDLKVNLVLSGLDRYLEFSQRVSDSAAVVHTRLGATFVTIKRNMTISVIREGLVDSMMSWATQHLDVTACKSFGVSYSKLKMKSYWMGVAKRGTHFAVALDEEIVGYVPCFNINSLDNTGIPAYYGATQRRTIAHRNLACLGYLKSNPRPDRDDGGVMQFAVQNIINWILGAEQRITGCIVVVKIPHSDVDSSKPDIIQNIVKSRRLAESLNMKAQPEFHGSRMGNNNAYLLLRENCEYRP